MHVSLDRIGIPGGDTFTEFYRFGERAKRDATIDFAAAERNDLSKLPKSQK